MKNNFFKPILLFIPVFLLLTDSLTFAQKVGETEKIERDIEQEKVLRERIEKVKEEPQIKEEPPTEAPSPQAAEKIAIRKINVTGVTLLPEKEIYGIISPLENKELTLRELQKAADLITDSYRKKGYITSRAYLPPQKLEGGALEVRVIEGVTGDIEIKGNRYFKTSSLKKKITLKKGAPFNYNVLTKNLNVINRHPDRNVRTVLMPGREPLSTDMLLEVKDRIPIHLDFSIDNYGSRFLGQERFKTALRHNNFLGFDDILSLQYQSAEAENYRLLNARYLIPVSTDLQLGVFAARAKLRLGEVYEDLNARGKSEFYGIYAAKGLVDEDNMDITLNLGFDYKDIINFQLGDEVSRDRLRVAKTSLDFDLSDRFGRTIISEEMAYGVPDLFGGLKRQDARASRADSGGRFVKHTVDLIRLNRMPFNSTLLWKNQLQLSPYILPAAEQFQIGGISNMRGYPAAEVVGDKGYSSSWEFSFPVYVLPRNLKVPFSKAKFYDALRLIAFYDWANARLIRPQPGEEETKTLRSAGCGLRFNLPEDFSLRTDIGWALDNEPSDNDNVRVWTEVSKSF